MAPRPVMQTVLTGTNAWQAADNIVSVLELHQCLRSEPHWWRKPGYCRGLAELAETESCYLPRIAQSVRAGQTGARFEVCDLCWHTLTKAIARKPGG